MGSLVCIYDYCSLCLLNLCLSQGSFFTLRSLYFLVVMLSFGSFVSDRRHLCFLPSFDDALCCFPQSLAVSPFLFGTANCLVLSGKSSGDEHPCCPCRVDLAPWITKTNLLSVLLPGPEALNLLQMYHAESFQSVIHLAVLSAWLGSRDHSSRGILG